MGGNNPIVVWDTADVHTAAVVVVQSAFMSAGQRCTAAKRLIVKDSLYDALLSQVKKIADRLIVGEPHSQPAPILCPVIDNQPAHGLTESFLVLLSNGCEPINHMVRPIQRRPYLSPPHTSVTDLPSPPP